MFRTTLRSLWSHKRRLISTCVAVILGVAFMSGTLVLNSTISKVLVLALALSLATPYLLHLKKLRMQENEAKCRCQDERPENTNV